MLLSQQAFQSSQLCRLWHRSSDGYLVISVRSSPCSRSATAHMTVRFNHSYVVKLHCQNILSTYDTSLVCCFQEILRLVGTAWSSGHIKTVCIQFILYLIKCKQESSCSDRFLLPEAMRRTKRWFMISRWQTLDPTDRTTSLVYCTHLHRGHTLCQHAQLRVDIPIRPDRKPCAAEQNGC